VGKYFPCLCNSLHIHSLLPSDSEASKPGSMQITSVYLSMPYKGEYEKSTGHLIWPKLAAFT
jgi:hypothetical protein